MQTKPTGWAERFAAAHKTEYRFVVNNVAYAGSDIQSTPVLSKAFADRLSIGVCCSGTLRLVLREKANVTIPKAASVVAYCRLTAPDGTDPTDWVEQGHYFISSRSSQNGILTLSCRDLMLKARSSYWDKTQIKAWPATMAAVVNDIAAAMGVAVDSRTQIQTGTAYKVTEPDGKATMMDVLSGIAAAHAGNFVITEAGALRLITILGVSLPAKQVVGSAYKGFTKLSVAKQITKMTLRGSDGTSYSAGTDNGTEIAANCPYASQEAVDALFSQSGGMLYGVSNNSYAVSGVYLDPCVELGDTVQVTDNGKTRNLVVASANIRCNASYNADLAYQIGADDEDEYPYISSLEKAERKADDAVGTAKEATEVAKEAAEAAKDAVKKYELDAAIDTYINSETGQASIVASLSGRYVESSDLDGYTKKTELSAEIGAYIDTAAGTAQIVNNLSGTFLKEDDLSGYVEKTELNTEISSYIDTAAGTAQIVSAVSGTYQKQSDMDSYVQKTELSAEIGAYIDTAAGTAKIVNNLSGTYQKKSDMGSYVTTTTLNTSVAQYIDSAAGKAKIISACSGTYVTGSDLAGYAKASALTSIEQSVSDVEAAITLSSSYSKSTIGTNVYALLQLVSNANSSSIKIKADKIDFTGFTTFVKASDLGAGGTTTIDGGRITTGKISADRVDIGSLKVDTVYGKSSNTKVVMTTDTTSVYIGADSFSPQYNNIFLAASSMIYFGQSRTSCVCVDMASDSLYSTYSASKLGTDANPWAEIHGGGAKAYHIVMKDTVIRPNAASTYSNYSLGTSAYPWNAIYTKKLYLNGTELTGGGSGGNPTKLYYSSSNTTYYVEATSGYALVPSHCTSYTHWNLGSSSYYWYDCYLGYGSTRIGYNTSSKLGFFGTTPVTRQTVASSATVATLITALKAYGLIG